MKKYFFTMIIISFLLTGCNEIKKQEIPINPYEIAIKNKILSYYDIKENVPNTFNVLDISLDNIQNINNNILIDTDGNIRYISIINNDIITYNNISVGNKINKIEDNFLYEYKSGNNYMVIFNKNSEEQSINQNKKDDWFWINYITDGTKITQIQLYDVKFGNEMK